MAEILHTRDHQEAARALAGRYDRVLIRNKHILWKPIRLRRATIADLEPRIVLNPQQFDTELHAWNRDGGVLIYDRDFKRDENVAAHHAQLISECPLSVEMLERMTEGTRETIVVYRPPNWREHERAVRDFFPDAALCERFYRIVLQGAKPSDEQRAAMGSSEEGHLVTDAHMMAEMKMSSAQVCRVRRAMLRKREWKMMNPVVLRIEPPDATLAQVYRFIERECPKVNGEYLLVGSKLTKAIRFWRVALRALERCGSIVRRPTIYFYLTDGLEPDWRKIQRRHEQVKLDLINIAAYIDATPELNPQAWPSRRSLARPAPSPRLSVA